MTPSLVTFLSLLTIAGQIFFLVLLVLSVAEKAGWKRPGLFTETVDRFALPLLLLVALVATGGSLSFSEILGWVPCKLCWFQRIFMYPQAALLLLAVFRNHRGIAPSIVFLCVIGALFSIEQYREQLAAMAQPASAATACDASGVSCSTTEIFLFGYVTIPLMALTAFAMNALVALRISASPPNPLLGRRSSGSEGGSL